MPTIENARYFCQGCRQAFAENDLQAVALKSTDEQTGVCNDCRQPLLPEQFVRALKGQQIHNGCLFNLQGADLGGAYLERANLRRADLRGADLRGANLRRADLRVANLQGADLWGADLRGADLRGAYLERAYLERTNLEGADLDAAGQRIYVAQQF